jgi:2-haloacid dehalogenase
MPNSTLSDIRACVFDAYGTLLDFGSAAASCADVLGAQGDALTRLWRDKQLQYSWLRAAQGRHADFWQVTGDALDYSMETLGLSDPALRERLMSLYLTLAPFPEARSVLARLKRAGMRTATLSNGAPKMLNTAIDAADLTPLLDAVISIEEAGVFKPHPSTYRLCVDRMGLPADSICYISANGWDAYAASAFGMRVVWCNRYGQRPERLPGNPDCVVTSLDGLPALLGL